MSDDAREKPDEYWKEKLSPEEFRVCRLGGTEAPGSGKYDDFYEEGVYFCKACGAELFKSDTKYKSGSGWPSFFQPAREDAIENILDESHGMRRTEIRCKNCSSHLGHVFDDGPAPTGKRFCTNSLALDFKPKNPK